jgi:EmrB/QacA subfamily drug resistance transporter
VSDSAAPHVAAPGDETRRWVTLAVILMSTLIVVLDNTVLNVAIPTILRDFHTTVPTLEWVITGYALTFATLLIIGGRLGDLYGTRRMFIIGAGIFATGSLLAALSWNVGSLILGEAVIEGIGASMMLPATLSILSSSFHGHERATAFAMWGAVAGSAAGLGPLVGGFLTTEASWRWSFGINVIIAPLAMAGAFFFIASGPRAARGGDREALDGGGAALIATGMFALVFAISEGGTYGWFRPIADFRVASWDAWPTSRPVSLVPPIFVVAFVLLFAFYHYERRRPSPLFEFSLLRHRTFRYGLLSTVVLAMGQFGMSLTLALFLQESLHLTALQNGLWMLPFGMLVLIASPIGGRLAHMITTVSVVRIGLVSQAVSLIYIAMSMNTHTTFLRILPGLVCYGIGSGFAMSQLTNVVLSEIPNEKSGVASGTNTTSRQVGSALGIAVIGTVVTVETINHATSAITRASLAPGVKQAAIDRVHSMGANYTPAASNPATTTDQLSRIVARAVATAGHDALLFAAGMLVIGTGLSLLIPNHPLPVPTTAEELATLVPIDAEAAVNEPA